MIKIGQIMAKKCQNGHRRAWNRPFFKICPWYMIIENFLVRKMPLIVNLDPNLPKQDFFRKWPKIGQKMRKIKTCHWPPILVSHMKFSKKSYFEWVPLIKIGQIMAKKCQNGLGRSRKMPFFIMWLRILKIQNFSVKKLPLVVDFDPNLEKRHFLPQKRRSATFRWDQPFSIAFLWSQSSGFASNFQNQVRNCDFGGTIPARLTALQKNGENQKTVLPDSFLWFDCFQSTK